MDVEEIKKIMAAGIAAKEKGDWKKMVKVFTKAAKRAKDPALRSKFIQNVGSGYFGSRQFDKAMEYFSRAYEVDPSDPAPMFQLAHVLVVMKRTEEAIELFERFLPSQPLNFEEWAMYAYRCLDVGDEAKARRAGEATFKARPYMPETIIELFQFYEKMGDGGACIWLARLATTLWGKDLGDIVSHFEAKGFRETPPFDTSKFTVEERKRAARVIWYNRLQKSGRIDFGPRTFNIQVETFWNLLRHLENLDGYGARYHRVDDESYYQTIGDGVRQFEFDFLDEQFPTYLEFRVNDLPSNETKIVKFKFEDLGDGRTRLEHNLTASSFGTYFMALLDRATILYDKHLCEEIGLVPF
ncbi:MAG: tetratricopeptide repeat protein [Promethearchaeota archaeon]